MTGPDAQQAADWLFTADTRKEPNKIVYTCALNHAGGVESDLTVTAIESGSGQVHSPAFKDSRGFYIVAGGASAHHTYSHILAAARERRLDVDVRDVTDRMGVLSVQGEQSRNILQKLTRFELTDSNLPLYTSAVVSIDGPNGPIEVRAMRISFVGELGYELHVANDQCVPLYRAIREAGEEFGLRNAGYRSFYALSNEKGYHLWNFDLRMDDTPLEANLGFVCRREGDYQGKPAIERQRAEGIRKRLVTFELDASVPLWGMEGVYRDGVAVGHVRRADSAFSLQRMLGKAYVRNPSGAAITAEYLKAGRYEIDVFGRRHEALLLLRSPFDPENKRLNGDYSG